MTEPGAAGYMPISSYLGVETSTSKYLCDSDETIYELNISQRREWNEFKNDPVFAKIPANCDIVSFDTLISRRKDMTLVLSDSESEEDHEVGNGQDHCRVGESKLLDHEAGTSEARSHQEDARHDWPQQPEIEKQRIIKEQEERLAALGVTGRAKPVRNTIGRPFAISTGSGMHSLQSDPASNLAAHDVSNKFGQNPFYHRNYSESQRTTTYDHSYDQTPAHLPYLPISKLQDDPRSPHSSLPGYWDGHTCEKNSPAEIQIPPIANEYGSSPLKGTSPENGHRPTSPQQSRPDYSLSRKRSYEQSFEKLEGPKRQQDYAAYRNQRKHPKVADAYK
jgi:hypothetical protein